MRMLNTKGRTTVRSTRLRSFVAASVTGLALVTVACGDADYTVDSNFHNPVVDSGGAGDGGTAGGGFDDGGYDPSQGLGDGGCVGTTQNGEIAAADLLLVVDKSYSTDFPNVGSKWLAIKSALKSFVANPRFAGLGVGLQYLPLPLTCDVDGYAKPAVDLGILPGVASAVSASLDLQKPSGGTPMAPALKGALTYAQARAVADPKRKIVVVLATDGIPDDLCSGYPNTIAKVVEIATAGAAAKVPTFVIAVGAELSPLNAIAQAGGSGDAIVVDTNGDVESQFLAALQRIRKLAIGCDYTIPAAPIGSVLDYSKINVRLTLNGQSTAENLSYAKSQADCGNGRSWYYDNPAAPTKVVLCPQVCSDALASDNPKVDVVLGCTSVVH